MKASIAALFVTIFILMGLLTAEVVMGPEIVYVTEPCDDVVVIAPATTVPYELFETTYSTLPPEELQRYHNLEEAPQIWYEGEGRWTSPPFTVMNSWLLEYEGDVRIVTVRENGTRLARQAVGSGYAYYQETGTFHLEFYGNGTWTATIAEG